MKNLLRLISVLILVSILNPANAQQIDNQKVSGFFQEQQFEEAIAYVKPFEQADSRNIKLLGYMGYAYYMSEEDKKAKGYFEKILTLDSENISALRYLATLTANKEFDTALILNKRLIRLQPGVSAYYRNAADAFKKLRKQDSALLYFNKAYAISPNDLKNAAALADMLVMSKSFTRADSVLEVGLALDSINSNLLRLRIKSAYDAGDYIAAINPGERMMRGEDLSSTALTQVALAYYNLKKYRDSYRVCQFLLDNGFETEAVFFYQAKAANKLKEYSKSNALLAVCLSKAISETAELYYYNLGQNYEATKQYKKAISQYDTAYFMFKSANMLYYMANIYEVNLKDIAQAKKYYTRFLATARPSTAEEKSAYAYVRERWGKPGNQEADMHKTDSTALKEED